MRLMLAMPGNEKMGALLAARLGCELGQLETRRFPDGESYVRLLSDVEGKQVGIVCTLAQPDEQFLRLIFTATTARELGAASIALVAPYLAYMRQDKRFKEGEAVSSAPFAGLISGVFDGLVTVDPHLHRRRNLGEIFSVPTYVARAAPLLGDWISQNVDNPLIVGPDSESEQWVSAVAARASAPHVVLEKQRFGDRDVSIAIPDLASWVGREPVLIDDIVSSGRTMIEAARGFVNRGFAKPYCLAVHALFAEDSYAELRQLSAGVVTTDAIPHPSNGISVAQLLADAFS